MWLAYLCVFVVCGWPTANPFRVGLAGHVSITETRFPPDIGKVEVVEFPVNEEVLESSADLFKLGLQNVIVLKGDAPVVLVWRENSSLGRLSRLSNGWLFIFGNLRKLFPARQSVKSPLEWINKSGYRLSVVHQIEGEQRPRTGQYKGWWVNGHQNPRAFAADQSISAGLGNVGSSPRFRESLSHQDRLTPVDEDLDDRSQSQDPSEPSDYLIARRWLLCVCSGLIACIWGGRNTWTRVISGFCYGLCIFLFLSSQFSWSLGWWL